MCRKKYKFFVICDNWSPKSRNFHYEALKTLKMYLMDFTRVVHLDPSRGLTASRVPELHWQLALTRT